jgi:hypothetical protein
MLSAGMFVLAKAGKEFNNVDWNSLVKMGSIFAVFGLTVRFGSKMFAAASKDLLQFIAAFDLLALGMLGFSMSSRHMTDGIKDLSNIKNLSELALDIGLLGAALATFGITASTGGLINLFGGSGLVNKLITLSSLGGGLEKTARALTSINTSLAGINNNLNNGTFKEGISELVKSLTELNGEVDKTNFKKLQTISSLINTQSGNEEKTNPICKKLDELISLMKAGGIAVNIDGRKMSNALANASN